MHRKNNMIRSLCAVMLVFSMLLPRGLSTPARAVEGDAQDPWRYALSVEFGSLSFYYDHGVWDVNTMTYVASTTDNTAAESTTPGQPGWYGFDDTANKIMILNESPNRTSVDISLTFRSLTAAEAGENATDVVQGVSMTIKDAAGSGWTGAANSYEATAAYSTKVTALIQLHGEPRLSGGGRYTSDQMLPVGMLTLAIHSPR